MKQTLLAVVSAVGATLFVSTAATAQMTCAALGVHLAAQPNVVQIVSGTPPVATAFTTLFPASGANARCEANFIYSSRGDVDDGYAPGQPQRIVLRVGLPLNATEGGTGGVQGAWNGKVRNLGGGGLVGNVGAVTAATNTRYVGSSTDSGHPAADNPNFAVIQELRKLNTGRLADFLHESIRRQYQWALKLAQSYYGVAASRNYWDGCSTGGRQGLALALKHGKDFDGFLVGAPANFHTRLQVATVWPTWVNKDVANSTLTNVQMQAANASAIAACDAQDGVVDGVIGDQRTCKFSAKANVCGQPGAPAACLTPAQATAIDMIWDGPRNDHGKRIWFPFGRGANASVQYTPTGAFGGPCGSLGIFCWSHKDTTFDWTTLPLAQFDDETQLATREVARHSDITSTDLDRAKRSGAKILMWHGGTDQLIPWRQSAHYYREAAEEYGGFNKLSSWFRFFLAPGVNHCGGGTGPQPQSLFDRMVNWVETGVAPDTITAQNPATGTPTRTRPLCPYPQTALYNGTGDTNLAASFTCGGNIETRENRCEDRVTKFRHETRNELEDGGKHCKSNHHSRRGHRDDRDDHDDHDDD
jgi:Tannase and feruloyl esterase